MRSSTSGLRADRTRWLQRLVMVGMGLVCLGALNLAGCPKPTYQPMYEDVSLRDILKITTNTEFDEDEKTGYLEDLGIEDEQVIFLLINAPMPVELPAEGADQ